MVKNVGEMPDKNEIRLLEKKLDRCRNPENNPENKSEEYRNRTNQLLNEDEDAPLE